MDLPSFFLFVVGILHAASAGPEYDFEDPSQMSAFIAAGSTRAITQSYYKTGSKSLLWQWGTRNQGASPPKLTVQLGLSLKLKDKELQKGGIKFWMYHENVTPSSTMEITFRGENESGQPINTTPTTAKLNFQGWRGVWIGYEEFGSEMTPFASITNVDFKITTTEADKLYFDAVRFVPSLRKQSRDLIVQKVGSSGRSNDPMFYDDKDFWQQSLRWHLEGAPRSTTPVTNVDAKLSEIQAIETQLQNWYAKEDETLKTVTKYDDFAVDMAMDPDGGIDFIALKKKRWQFLQRDIEAANTYYSKIDFNHNRPPLFSKVEELGVEDITDDPNCMSKFGFFFARILLPLSLEYNFMSRPAEVNALASKVCTNLKSTDYLTMLRAITEITGDDQMLVGDFQTILQTYKNKLNCASSRSDEELSAADLINVYNEVVRWERIKKLLVYMENQGWAEGSGLGSLDHEMNKAGSGFMHSMFLLRHVLRKTENAALLSRLLRTMKWYNDFNEIYQQESNYIYNGTTADRMRTISLFRLIIILITPNTNKENKVRDMGHFTVWMKRALAINKGLGGLIKPDYTGFHHKTFYGSAYVPHALHNAALIQYLLEVTSSFKLDRTSKDNLREALKVMRIIAVKYSSPNSMGGRFPGYRNVILAQHFVAYAYISYEKTGTTEKANGRDMFLRLFDHNEPPVKAYLEDGTIQSGIYYWNTIGQIDVFQKISILPCSSQCTAESSPSGHWSKNFAALSVHRRNNWTVAAKGFNRYIWDYESSPKENIFGVFASHGSLQISNSEATVARNNVSDGWDWTRVPGTTTIKAELVNIVLGKARNYNPGHFAGGVSFTGSVGSNPRNGAFGMFLKKPDYVMKNKASPMGTMEFEFKKSYFFYNDLIVCLGSDIKFKNRDIDNYYAQTTLFQDKLQDPTKPTTITIDSNKHDLRLLLKRQYRWTTGKTIRLVDTTGNTYQVKTAKSQGLNVEVLDQESVQTQGCEKTKGRYATAWFEHKQKQALSCGTTTVVSLAKKTTPKQFETQTVKQRNNEFRKLKTEEEPYILKVKKYRKNINAMTFKDQNIAGNINVHSGEDERPKDTEKKISNIKKGHAKKSVQKLPKNQSKIINNSTKKLKMINKTKKLEMINKTNDKTETNDDMYVNGININPDSDPKMEVVNKDQDEDLDDSVMGAEQWNRVNTTNIDEGNPETSDVDHFSNTSITDTDDDRGYFNDEEMDGLGTDIDYDDDSAVETGHSYIVHNSIKQERTSRLSKYSRERTTHAHNTKSSLDGENIKDGREKSKRKDNKDADIVASQETPKNEYTKHEDKESGDEAIGTNIDIDKMYDDKLPNKEKTNVQTQKEDLESVNTDMQKKSIQLPSSKKNMAEESIKHFKNKIKEKNENADRQFQENVNEDEGGQLSPNIVDEESKQVNATLNNNVNDNADQHSSADRVNNIKGRKVNINANAKHFENAKVDNDEGEERKTQVDLNADKHVNDDKDERVEHQKTKANKSTDKDENENEKMTQVSASPDNDENVEHQKTQVNASTDIDDNVEQPRSQVNASADIDDKFEHPNTQVNASTDIDEHVKFVKTQDTASTENHHVFHRKYQKTQVSSNSENDKQDKHQKLHINAITNNDGHVEREETPLNSRHDNFEDGEYQNTHVNARANKNKEHTVEPEPLAGTVSRVSKNNQKTHINTMEDTDKDENHGNTAKQKPENLHNLNSKKKSTKKKTNTNNVHHDKVLKDKVIGAKEELSKTRNDFNTKVQKGSPEKEDRDNKEEVNGIESNVESKQNARYGKKLKLKLKEKKIYYNKINKVMEVAIEKAKHSKHHEENVEEIPKAIDDAYYNSSLASDSLTNMETEEMQNDEDYTIASETSSYEYAIVIQGGNLNLFSKYKVIQASGKAHVVEFSSMADLPNTATKVFSYSIFEAQKATESISSGPVHRASAPCMIMAEHGASKLYLAVSNPAITFQDDPAVKDKDRCTRKGRKDIPDKFSPKNSDEVGAKMMFCVEGKSTSITVSLRLDNKSLGKAPGTVKVDGKVVTNPAAYISINAAKNEVTFLNLVNGLTTEVVLSHAYVSPKNVKI